MSPNQKPSHSPGPWRFVAPDIFDRDGAGIARRYAHNGAVQADMDGHLIAAAPDLLDAAILAVDRLIRGDAINEFVNELDGAISPLRAAIAKARGER